MKRNLRLLAGAEALKSIRQNGLDKDQVRIIPGAAGGPKWLVLGRLDRVIFGEWFKDRSTPVDVIGSSSGAWRFAAAAQIDPAKAEARLENTYISYKFDIASGPRRIKEQCGEMVAEILGPNGAKQALTNPTVRLHLMTARSTALTSGERKLSLGLPSVLAFLANAVSRNTLNLFFRRALFSDPRSDLQFNWADGLKCESYSLTEKNFADALLASGSIPIVAEGVKNIGGAKPGIYRDGGIIDYQFGSPLLPEQEDGIVLYPHYAPTVTPGWLDKHLYWRKSSNYRLARTLILTPSPEFVTKLPDGKIPIRQDFVQMTDDERIPKWRRAANEAERLADELREIIAKDAWNDAVEPLP